MENELKEQNNKKNDDGANKKSSVVIKIPSYEEVLQSSQQKSTPPSLFLPSQTFSQTFSFVKSSEFYAPPPPTTNTATTITAASSSISRESSQLNPPSSTSTSSAAAASSQVAQSRNAILVSHRQKGNPLLKHIRNVRWTFADIVCDYLLGQSSCALYISLRYHLLHPDYLYYRIRELQKNFKLRVVLCHVDVEDVMKPLLEVTKTALLHDCTLLCGWSLEECGRYLETIKVYENKPADIIQGQMDTDYLSRLTHALTTVRHVNKTDVVTLGTTFGSLSHIMGASMEDLARCPGIGERKVKRLFDTFHEPFKRLESSRQVIPETSVQDKTASPDVSANNDAEPCSLNEDKQKDAEDVNKRKEKEPELTVKSALSEAFAKYSNRIGKRNKTSQVEEKVESGGTRKIISILCYENVFQDISLLEILVLSALKILFRCQCCNLSCPRKKLDSFALLVDEAAIYGRLWDQLSRTRFSLFCFSSVPAWRFGPDWLLGHVMFDLWVTLVYRYNFIQIYRFT
ncbi:DNA excision repair protein ERCC-1 isoform X1 [Arachis ipaensis]|uniref:DNA excision repair protein ERCC-1 isoform X1 n=1 Tax=Arachis ipaensis TaxID=130454 RepID=UPI000A2B5677|nr:DNA excision repair protein ERCC-1 isoform X1 [Arachis ipaensis]